MNSIVDIIHTASQPCWRPLLNPDTVRIEPYSSGASLLFINFNSLKCRKRRVNLGDRIIFRPLSRVLDDLLAPHKLEYNPVSCTLKSATGATIGKLRLDEEEMLFLKNMRIYLVHHFDLERLAEEAKLIQWAL